MRRPGRGVRRSLSALLMALALFGVAACGGEAPGAGRVLPGGEAEQGQDANGGAADRSSKEAAELAQLREAAQIEACPTATGKPHEDGLPAVTLGCLGGDSKVRLDRLTGQPMVVNLWAQWCGPCREEAPYIQQLHERSGDRLLVLGIDYLDPQADRALRFARELGLRYPQLADPEATLRAPLQLRAGIPATVFVEKSGRVAHVARKPYRSYAELTADVERHVGVRL